MNELNAELRPPGLRLSRRWLTVSLIAVTMIPVSVVLSVWFFVPEKPEPPLPAVIAFRPISVSDPNSSNTRLLPGLVLTNPTSGDWQNISLSINKQFYVYYGKPLLAGKTCEIPLSEFRTSGNQGFRPRSQTIKLLTIYAQLPSGARAIYESAPNEQPRQE